MTPTATSGSQASQGSGVRRPGVASLPRERQVTTTAATREQRRDRDGDDEPRGPDGGVALDEGQGGHEQGAEKDDDARHPPRCRQVGGARGRRPGPVVEGGDGDRGDPRGADHEQDAEHRRLVQSGAPDQPGEAGGDAEHDRRGGAHEVAVQQRPECPHPDQPRLVGRHLEALRCLEDDRPEEQRRQQPSGVHHGGGHRAAVGKPHREQLGADRDRGPDRRDHAEAAQRRQPVEVGRDQPDEAEADEDGAEGEQQPGEAEGAGGVVAADQCLGLVGLDQPVPLPVDDLVPQPLQVAGRDGTGGALGARRRRLRGSHGR